MSFEERELKELIEIKDISLAYEQSYDLNISDRGIFIVDLELEFSEFNEGDTLLLRLNQDVTKNLTILTRQKTYIKINETLINQGDGCKIEIINKSDDVLLINTIRGGIFVDNGLQILNIYNINPKSFDLTLNEAFNGTEIIRVYETNNPAKTIATKLVPSSLTDSPDTMVVLVDSDIPSEMLQAKTDYTLRVIRGTETASTIFQYANFNPISNATVTAKGYRVISVSFDYPVKNLDSTITHIDPYTGQPVTELLNFYLLYYGLDTDSAEGPDKEWLGYISIGGASGNTATVSQDLKTLEIQFDYRSMPIGTHKFIVNYSKHQTNPNQGIMDYAIPSRVLPIIEKDIIVNGATTITRPVKVTVLSRKELVVEFSNPVLLLPTELPISVVGQAINVTSNERYSAEYTEIKYNVNALPVGDIQIVVGSITDAYGYATEVGIFNVTVVAEPPVILKVIQDPLATTTTELLVTFSTTLNKISAETLANYTLLNPLGVPEVLSSATLLADNMNVRLVYSILSAGIYNFHAQDVEDDLGLAMIPYTADIEIEDYTVPAVVEIIATRNDNVMIIKFNDPMNVSDIAEDSALNSMNYLANDIILPPLTLTAALKGDKWIRFTVPASTPVILPFTVGETVNIGYPRVKDVRYVTNASGNIYPLCVIEAIDRLIDPIDIRGLANSIEINDEKSFIFKYVGDNEFISVNKDDFEFRLNGNLQPIDNVNLLADNKSFVVNFANEIFNSSVNQANIEFKTKNATLLSRDIFDKPIVKDSIFNGTVKNSLNAKIKAISLLSTTQSPTTATLAMKFTNIIKTTSANDFMVVLNNTTVLPISAIEIVSTNPDTIKLVVNLINPLIFTDILTVSVARDEAVLETIDINDNKIDLFAKEPVQKFTIRNIAWNANNSSAIVNDKLSVVFNGAINPASLNPTWDGLTPITVSPGSLKIEQILTTATAEVAEIYVDTPTNLYGKFRVLTPLGQPFVAANSQNANDVTITLVNGDTLEFKFTGENIPANIQGVIYAIYEPKPFTSDADNKLYVNEDYKPTTRPVVI